MKPPIRRLFTPRLAALSGPSMQRVGPTTHLHDMGNYQGIGKPGEGILLQVDYSRATLSPSRYSSFASAPTHARASTATVRDYSGKVLDCQDSEIRFEGAYRTFVNDGAEHGAGVVGVKYITDYYSPTERTTALTPSDAGAYDQFGTSCALSADGSALAVGANQWDGGAGNDQGAVYVFDRNGSAWVERTTALVPSDAGDSDLFGASCALSADGAVLAVGANRWNGPVGVKQGCAYVFDWNGSAWVERSTALTPSDAGTADNFGASCALSADGAVLAVGALLWDGPAGSNQGGAYVFDWNGSAWVERTTALVPSDAGASDQFGSSCALSADGAVLAVGANLWDGGAGNDQGAVYVFDRNGSAWVERTTALTPSDAGGNDRFGTSCALSADGSALAVGALLWDGGAGNDQGAVYVFDWNGSAWVERSTALTPSDAGASDSFGASCALSADGAVLAVGARSWDGGAGSNQGAVYVFDDVSTAYPITTPITFLKEDAATNLFLNTAAPVTQAVATVNATEYTYWIEGTGSMTLSGGATGVATEGSPVTATASGSTTCTLSGTVTFAQVEAGDKPTSHIPTAGASTTRAADSLSYSNVPAVNETRVEIEGEADSDTDDWDGTVDETGNLEILTVYGTGMRP